MSDSTEFSPGYSSTEASYLSTDESVHPQSAAWWCWTAEDGRPCVTIVSPHTVKEELIECKLDGEDWVIHMVPCPDE